MITLNLISQELKKEIKLRHIYKLIKKINYILIIISLTMASILLVARIILQNNFNKIVEQTTLVTKNNQGYNNKVRQINEKINFVSQIQNDFILWSNLIEQLAKITPNGINFYALKINLEQKEIIIKGKAAYRDNLLSFKKNLEESTIYQNIEFPLKNILERENINFEINAKIDEVKIKTF